MHSRGMCTTRAAEFGTGRDAAKGPCEGKRVNEKILRELRQGGLEPTDSDPDLYITYHVTTRDNMVLNTTSYGYGGYGAGWGGYGRRGRGYRGGHSSSTTTASTYTEGTLIVDAHEPGAKKMVWRGTGTVTIQDMGGEPTNTRAPRSVRGRVTSTSPS